MAAVYSLRMYIRSMHNRTGPDVESRELRLVDGLVLAPFIAAIVLFALYPQLELHRAEKSVTGAVADAQAIAKAGPSAVNGILPAPTASAPNYGRVVAAAAVSTGRPSPHNEVTVTFK